MSNTIAFEISRLPLSVVAGAYNTYAPNPVAGVVKMDAVKVLAELVERGHITIDNIRNSTPTSVPVKGATIDASTMTRIEIGRAHVCTPVT